MSSGKSDDITEKAFGTKVKQEISVIFRKDSIILKFVGDSGKFVSLELKKTASGNTYDLLSSDFHARLTEFKAPARPQRLLGFVYSKRSGSSFEFTSALPDSSERVLQATNTSLEIIGDVDKIQFWEGCFENNSETYVLDIGIATDLSYVSSFDGDRDSALQEILHYVAATNIVYQNQMNMVLRVNQVIISTENFKGENAINFLTECPSSITQLLEQFGRYVYRFPDASAGSSYPSKQGLWHLFTGCFSSNVVGLGYVGPDKGFCSESNRGRNVAVSSRVARDFLLFGHEVGHNIGGKHVLDEDDNVSLIGLMGYGAGQVNEAVQFTEINKRNICPVIHNLFEENDCASYINKEQDLLRLFGDYTSQFAVIDTTGAATDGLLAIDNRNKPLMQFIAVGVSLSAFFFVMGVWNMKRSRRMWRRSRMGTVLSISDLV